jgi:hypothetical protein
MAEILDPRDFFSFLTHGEVCDRAEEVITDPTLQSELSEDNLNRWVNEFDQTIVHPEEIRKFLVIAFMSRHCIQKLMQDEKGRTEHHIAGETCRLNRAAIILAHLNKVENLVKLPEFDDTEYLGLRTTPHIWVPEGTQFPCPTIDGQGANRIRQLISRTGERYYAASRHFDWHRYLTEEMLPQDPMLRLLEPPFVLNSGEIIAATSPRFFQLDTTTRSDVETEPRVLVNA